MRNIGRRAGAIPNPTRCGRSLALPRMWERASRRTPTSATSGSASAHNRCPPRWSAPELGGSEAPDPVTSDALHRLLRERSTVARLPVTVDLSRARRGGGRRRSSAARAAAVRAMVCQLAVLHGPAHVAVAAVVGQPAASDLGLAEMASAPPPAVVGRRGRTGPDDPPRPAAVVPDAAPTHTVVIVDGGVVPAPYAPVDGTTVVTIGEVAGGPGCAGEPADRRRAHCPTTSTP